MSLPCGCGSDEKESPPEKKLKLEADDEDETGSDLKVENDDQNGSDLKVEDADQNGSDEELEYDSDDCFTWPNKRDVFNKYYEQLDESDGFDFDEYPGSSLYAPIWPIVGFERFPEFVDRIKGYASLAIKQHFGNDGEERNVKEILKLNAGCPRDFAYFITFKIDNEGKEETFQAKVERTIEGRIEIPLCRRKD